MATAHHRDPLSDRHSLSYQRYLLVLAPAVYLSWWFVVEFFLHSKFNPLGSRLAVCGLFLFVLIASYYFSLVQKYLKPIYGVCSCILTVHFYYLFSNNTGDLNWIVGSYFTILAVGVTIVDTAVLIFYSLLVIFSTYYISTQDRSNLIGIPGILTLLVLVNLVAFLQNKIDSERAKRIQAEGDRLAAVAASRSRMLFLSTMSHELRTPLTSIIGFSDLLSDANELSDESRDKLNRVRQNSYSLLNTVDQVLTLTTDDLSGLKVKKESLDIRNLLVSRVENIQPICTSKNLSLSLTFSDPFPDVIYTDPGFVTRIFDNVLNNACKFTSVGGIEIQATQISPAGKTDFVELKFLIRDTGIGIASHQWEKIFEPFIQVQDSLSRSFEGSGLGLTVARKLSRALQGDISVVWSALSQGTLISVTIKAPLNSDL